MALSSCIELDQDERSQLLAIARQAIGYGLRNQAVQPPPLEQLPASLKIHAAVFVTLTRNKQLRGCIGSLQACEALAVAVANAAHSAAFRDPRFPGLRTNELADIAIEISVLSALQPLEVAGRDELLAVLRPGLDGLLLAEGARHQATFLPKVWQQLPSPERFLGQLLEKAGLPNDHWSSQLRLARYQALCFDERGV